MKEASTIRKGFSKFLIKEDIMGKYPKNHREAIGKGSEVFMPLKPRLFCPLFTFIYTKYIVNNVNKEYLHFVIKADNMRLLKIDPQAQTVEAVETTGTLHDMYRLIDCRMIDVCARQDNGDSLTVDDEALYVEPQPAAFSFNGYGPVHGVALLTGTDEEGGTEEPAMTLEEAIGCITWLGDIYTRPTLTVVPLYDHNFGFPS
jgi:hypothetical protein